MSTLSFTQLRHRAVHDSQGSLIGQLEDLFVLPLGTRPQVTKFNVRRPDREEWVLPWSLVAEIPGRAEIPIRLRSPLNDLSPVTPRPEEVLLGKTVLDRKVVDTARKKVVRVNDIELTYSEGALHVMGVEGGVRGLLRHLHSEPLGERLAALFGKCLPRDVVLWEVLDPIETELSRAKRQAVYTKLAKLQPADIADIMGELTPGERATVLAALDEATAAEAITEVGIPLEIPVPGLGETQMRPTARLFRNLAAMAVEELLRADPIDGAVLLGGCDKTIPALLMGACSVDLPSLVVPGGPMLTGTGQGAPLGCGTDVWRLSEEVRAGTLDRGDFLAAESDYDGATHAVRSVFDRLRGTGLIDLDSMSASIHPLIEHVMHRKEAMVALVRIKKKE